MDKRLQELLDKHGIKKKDFSKAYQIAYKNKGKYSNAASYLKNKPRPNPYSITNS